MKGSMALTLNGEGNKSIDETQFGVNAQRMNNDINFWGLHPRMKVHQSMNNCVTAAVLVAHCRLYTSSA